MRGDLNTHQSLEDGTVGIKDNFLAMMRQALTSDARLSTTEYCKYASRAQMGS